ncbi:putative amino-acid metabolite efflux pump [compost metagenome]
MKLALAAFTPFQLGAARYVVAVIPLIFFIRFPTMPWRWVVLGGLAQVGQFGFLFVALSVGMTAALASVLMQTQVFFTTLLGAALLKEKITVAQSFGLGIALLGIGCFGLGVGAQGAAVTLIGLILNLCAASMWAASNIVVKKAQAGAPGYDALQYVVWMSAVPVLPFLALSYFFEPEQTRFQWLDAAPLAWASVAYLGLIATVSAYFLWTWLLQRYPANRVAPLSLAVPVVGLSAGMLVLGEQVSPWQYAGSMLVVGALLLFLLGSRMARQFTADAEVSSTPAWDRTTPVTGTQVHMDRSG